MNRILLLTLLALVFVACSSDEDSAVLSTIDEDVSGLSFAPTVSKANIVSRAAIAGVNFLGGDEVGYMLLGSFDAIKNPGQPHLKGYGNVKAIGARVAPPPNDGTTPAYADMWTYYVNNLYMGSRLAGYPSYGNLDIYAYYPYNEDLSEADKNAIPFSIGNVTSSVAYATEEQANKDYMWATPKLNYDISIPGNTPVSIQFTHLMTYLEFRVRKLYYGPALTVKEIHYEITSGSRKFSTKGTYDSATGAIITAPEGEVDKIVVSYDKILANGVASNIWLSCPIIIPEMRCANDNSDDATIAVTFVLEDQDELWDFQNGGVYTFKLSDVVNSGDKGLIAGNKYRVDIDVSNIVKYSGTPQIVNSWETGSTEDPVNPGTDLGIIEI